jgi:TolB-like protein/Tfp pilus assembly protein PilF
VSRKPELLSVAESVADGTPVDWRMLETHATNDERPVIEQLRILSDLVGLHRSLPADSSDRPPLLRAEPAAVPVIGSWGHLALLERLGGGTFGEVYRAWDRQLEREVAVKLLRGEASSDDPRASRIAAEGRMLARVRHPNVITVYGAAVHEGRVGLWMELVRGATLEQLLQQRGPLSAREGALIGIDLCRALAALHAAGLIHRDVKAQNVMREDGGRIVLMDLGTGRESGEPGARASADMAGTPLYLAPEIFDGASASARTDVYSLGVLLYRLVTASFPVRATTIDALRAAHEETARVLLRDARADLPTAFVRVVDRATSSDPEKRYATAGALEADLVRALDESASAEVSKQEDRRGFPSPWRAGLIAAGVLALVLAVATALWTGDGRTPEAAAAPARSLAVLPLVNLSGDPSQQYFADGMTDELISTLGRVAGLDVISQTSVMRFRDSNTPLPEIAKALGVGAVLEGSLLVVSGDAGSPAPSKRVRISARLLRAGTDTQLWNRTFEREMTDVLRLQSEIAAAVAEGIGVELLSEEPSPATQTGGMTSGQPPQSPDAFDLYLRGRYQWNMRTREGLNRSIQYFREAVDRDPNYARAYAGLADAYSLLPIYGSVPRAEASAQAEAAARKALELDASLAEAHASLGLIQMERLEWDLAAASFQRAVQFKPGYASAHHWYAAYLVRRGQFDEALAEIQRAQNLDPLSAVVASQHGVVLLQARRYDDAIGRLEDALRLDRSYTRPHLALAEAYALKGDYARALAETERSAALGGAGVELSANIGYIHARAGRRVQALKVADGLAGQFRSNHDGAAYAAAAVYAGLRDSERVFEWLDRARTRRDNAIADLKSDARFDSVRNDPRYDKMLASIGLSR